jgi:hypothetical protein
MLGLPAPYRTPGNTASHSNRSYTLPGGSRQQAEGFALEHFTILHFLPRTIAYTAKQLHQQASGRSHPHNGWLNTDQEKDGRRWPPGSEPGAIQIVRDHLPRQLVYLHTIGSAAVQLCPDGDPKVIRLLSEGFLAGVKGVSYAISCHPKG